MMVSNTKQRRKIMKYLQKKVRNEINSCQSTHFEASYSMETEKRRIGTRTTFV
jgi:hypothetical protein